MAQANLNMALRDAYSAVSSPDFSTSSGVWGSDIFSLIYQLANGIEVFAKAHSVEPIEQSIPNFDEATNDQSQ